VLTAETRTREATEPSGEPDSLWGRMKGKMGDRASRGHPEGLDERKVKAKKKCARPRWTLWRHMPTLGARTHPRFGLHLLTAATRPATE